jgi:hypothetical protein
MPVHALWAALRRRFRPQQGSVPAPYALSSPPPSEPNPKPPQLHYPELVALIAADTALPPEQVRRVCDNMLEHFVELIDHDQVLTFPVFAFKVFTRPDQSRFARVVVRLPPAR